MMEFSVGEMTRRLKAAREKMDAAGIDCLMITGVENFSYFVGVPISLYQTRRPWCALVPLRSDPVALVKEGGALPTTLKRHGFFRDVETYGFPVADQMPRKIADLIKGCGVKRLACELGLEMRLGLPPTDFNAVVGLLPGVEIVDGAGIIWSLRMTKSPEEAARMKRACEITSAARQEVFRRVRPGMTEADVAALWADLMHEAGADRPSFIYVNSGDTPGLLPDRSKKLKRGETLWLDGGAYVDGYTCDFSRVAALGRPSPQQIQFHRDAVELLDMLLERARPGVPVADLAQAALGELERRGYSTHGRGVVAGHSMGMLINEPPLIAPWDDTVLTEGLVAGLELGPVKPEGFFILEHLLQVTRDGYDLFTTEPMTMVVVDF
jgi:Xaa-Pro aminopeptidase